MPLRFLGSLIMLVVACGNETRERLLFPNPKALETGESVTYLLDSASSSQMVTSGELVITIMEKTDVITTFVANAEMQTKFGPQKVGFTQPVANDVLTLDFIVSLRDTKTFVGAGYSIKYEQLTPEGCDEISIFDITQYPGVTLRPKICIATARAPSLLVFLEIYGLPIHLAFKQIN